MSQKVDLVFANKELAETYIQFRPLPPKDLILRILEFCKEKLTSLKLGLDIGCGSGQTTEQFADHFERVIGVDVSPDQLEIACQRNTSQNVIYKLGTAESLPAQDGSVDLVSACASVHWFDFENFYKEVDRVLRPGGVLACYSYVGCSPLYGNKDLRKEFMEIWDELNPYWTEKHRHLRTGYSTLPSIYPEDIHLTGFSVEHDATLETFMGYISSWSAFSKKKEAEGEVAIQEFLKACRQKLVSAMDTDLVDPPMRRRYDYFLRIWRKPTS